LIRVEARRLANWEANSFTSVAVMFFGTVQSHDATARSTTVVSDVVESVAICG
jgi:hypothetical protein